MFFFSAAAVDWPANEYNSGLGRRSFNEPVFVDQHAMKRADPKGGLARRGVPQAVRNHASKALLEAELGRKKRGSCAWGGAC